MNFKSHCLVNIYAKLCLDIDDFHRKWVPEKAMLGSKVFMFEAIDATNLSDLKVVPVYILTAVVKRLTFHSIGIFSEKHIC